MKLLNWALTNLLISELHDGVFCKISEQDRRQRWADAALHKAAAKISATCPGGTLTVGVDLSCLLWCTVWGCLTCAAWHALDSLALPPLLRHLAASYRPYMAQCVHAVAQAEALAACGAADSYEGLVVRNAVTTFRGMVRFQPGKNLFDDRRQFHSVDEKHD